MTPEGLLILLNGCWKGERDGLFPVVYANPGRSAGKKNPGAEGRHFVPPGSMLMIAQIAMITLVISSDTN